MRLSQNWGKRGRGQYGRSRPEMVRDNSIIGKTHIPIEFKSLISNSSFNRDIAFFTTLLKKIVTGDFGLKSERAVEL